MKPLEQNEIFQNLSGFLKQRGIELKEGSYSQGIEKSCALLTNAINLGQESLERAKVEFDKSMEHMRRIIHEKTAAKPPKTAAAPPSPAAESKPRAARPGSKPGKPKPQVRKKARRKAG
jgi:hypothetical protein